MIDCDSDDACFGTMKCFFRNETNPLEKVPHCVGQGMPEADYCYEPNKAKTVERPNTLQQRNLQCSEGNPCFQCQGGK